MEPIVLFDNTSTSYLSFSSTISLITSLKVCFTEHLLIFNLYCEIKHFAFIATYFILYVFIWPFVLELWVLKAPLLCFCWALGHANGFSSSSMRRRNILLGVLHFWRKKTVFKPLLKVLWKCEIWCPPPSNAVTSDLPCASMRRTGMEWDVYH